jgi:NADH:ubiquinone oxidoreductase subunit 6 (subunit J)
MKRKTSIGAISVTLGLCLCAIKIGGVGLATCPWWLASAPLWVPFALLVLLLVSFSTMVKAKQGMKNTENNVFENPCCCRKGDKPVDPKRQNDDSDK